MIVVPVPWFTVPSHADVLGADGRPTPVSSLGYPVDLSSIALRCVYTDAELDQRAVATLTRALGPLIVIDK